MRATLKVGGGRGCLEFRRARFIAFQAIDSSRQGYGCWGYCWRLNAGCGMSQRR